MDPRPCAACAKPLRPRAQRPDQIFCPAPECQRERKRRWQQERRKRDPDYRENEARGARQWRERHPEYWRRYREANVGYRERNRALQAQRDRNCARDRLANGDVSTTDPPIASGLYRLSLVGGGDIANGDVWVAEIRSISDP